MDLLRAPVNRSNHSRIKQNTLFKTVANTQKKILTRKHKEKKTRILFIHLIILNDITLKKYWKNNSSSNWSSRKLVFEGKYKRGVDLDPDSRIYHIITILGLLGI